MVGGGGGGWRCVCVWGGGGVRGWQWGYRRVLDLSLMKYYVYIMKRVKGPISLIAEHLI